MDIVSQRDKDLGRWPSKTVVMARRLEDVRTLDYNPNWRQVPTRPSWGIWTDQYSNIFRLLKWGRPGVGEETETTAESSGREASPAERASTTRPRP